MHQGGGLGGNHVGVCQCVDSVPNQEGCVDYSTGGGDDLTGGGGVNNAEGYHQCNHLRDGRDDGRLGNGERSVHGPYATARVDKTRLTCVNLSSMS